MIQALSPEGLRAYVSTFGQSLTISLKPAEQLGGIVGHMASHVDAGLGIRAHRNHGALVTQDTR